MTMKFNILKPALAALVLVGTACTANYLDINTNPYEPSEDDMQTDGYIIGSALTSLASTVVSTDVNTAQFTDVLLGGPMGGYYSTTGGFTRTIMNYNPTDDWTNVFMYSDRTIPVLYSNLRELKKVTDDPIVLAIADIIKVALFRVRDRLLADGLKGRLVLQVHDELIVECPEEEAPRVEALLQQEMQGVAELSVPLLAEAHTGRNWLAAKG